MTDSLNKIDPTSSHRDAHTQAMQPNRRSPLLLDRMHSLLLVVDLQEKLLPLIARHQHIAWNASRLLSAAKTLAIPSVVTEQYPEKLGATVPLGEFGHVDGALSKRMFSCRECSPALDRWRSEGRTQAVVCGIETHVCVLQTALDLLAAGWQVFVVADAMGSRADHDHSIALNRMSAAGAIVCTVESVLFEWCETSLAPEFRTISALVRQSPPTA